ncbi:MAG: site-2 protease family protein [candidate division Zixibacteria bacterium]|nr:site-2 protease family protein [candidate division Zixibacteria bacterium]MCI0595010.1 site-2 protease family protein [candidate division Zixibacteria bacterium]
MELGVRDYILLAPALIFALTFHEYAHAWMANRLGDPTAKYLGRLSFNPLVHLDLYGLLVLVMSGFRFGWAKPVPFNPLNLRHLKRDIPLIAVAGPAINVLIATGSFAALRLAGATSPGDFRDGIFMLLTYFIYINLSLAFFNLIPVPPLDGSKILYGFLPPSKDYIYHNLERMGPILLLGLILLNAFTPFKIISFLVGPLVEFTVRFLGAIFF